MDANDSSAAFMNHFQIIISGLLACALLATGCGRKTDVDSQLQTAAEAMAEPAPTVPVAAANPAVTPSSTPAANNSTPAPATEMNQAIAAYKSGNLEDAITRLQKLRATPVMTPQQRIALNDAMAAVMGEIYVLAAKGDARAQQAVKQYEKMQTQRR
jgi:hypothetical protein